MILTPPLLFVKSRYFTGLFLISGKIWKAVAYLANDYENKDVAKKTYGAVINFTMASAVR